MSDNSSAIRALARRCAAEGMPLPRSREVFDALYIAEVVAFAPTKREAAERAGITPETLSRMLGRAGADR